MITIEEALKFIRTLEEKVKPYGFHCGLTGSVLYKGYSEKDLDIIIYPHTAPAFADALIANVFPTACLCNSYNDKQRDNKTVYKMLVDGTQRVDLFFLS